MKLATFWYKKKINTLKRYLPLAGGRRQAHCGSEDRGHRPMSERRGRALAIQPKYLSLFVGTHVLDPPASLIYSSLEPLSVLKDVT